MSALDTQIGGSHYKDMPIQPMEFSMANNLDACQHTIIKYVARFREKGGVQDLEKAKHVIDMLIEFEGQAQASSRHLAQNAAAADEHDEDECIFCVSANAVSLKEALAKFMSATITKPVPEHPGELNFSPEQVKAYCDKLNGVHN